MEIEVDFCGNITIPARLIYKKIRESKMEMHDAIDFAKEKLRLSRIVELKKAHDRFNTSAINNDDKWVVLFTDKEKRVVKTAIQNEIARLQDGNA